MANKAVIPVFSASKAIQQSSRDRATFGQLNIPTNEAHGSFNKDTGVLTVKTAGVYMIHFSGVGHHSASISNKILLRVNSIVKAVSLNLHGSIAISSVLKLKRGDQVDIAILEGTLDESAIGAFTSFSALLLSY